MKKTRKKGTVSWIFITFCVVVSIFVFFSIQRTSTVETDYIDKGEVTLFNNSWTNYFGATVDVTALDFTKSKENVMLYATIPDEREGRQLMIDSRFIGYSLYLNNELVFDYHCKNDAFAESGDVPAPLLRVIDLSQAKKGDKLTIVIRPYDYIMQPEIREISIGTSGAVYDIFNSRMAFDVIFGGVLIFGGLMLMLMHLAFRRMLKKMHGLLYLAGYSIIYGISTLLSSQLFRVSVDVISINWKLSLGLVAFATVPLVLYLIESTESPRLENLQKIFALLVTLSILVISLLDVSNVLPFRTVAVMYLAVVAVSVIVLICVTILNLYVDAKLRIHNVLFLLGVLVICASTALEYIFRSVLGVDFGVLASVIFVAIISSVNISEVLGIFEYGMKAKLIDKLAYTDGLTGVGNTTAFRERLDYLEVTKVNFDLIGIIQFDVNNLKTVNDTLGHSFGDDLIIRAANIIKKSFGAFGDVYRVGGDEFAVITTSPKAASLCESAAAKFESDIDDVNARNELKYDIQIAYGIAFYRNEFAGKELFLRDVQKQADVLMYTMKKRMKEEKKTAVREGEKSIVPDKTVQL